MTASYVDRLLAAADGGPQLAPITDTDPHFGVERAYEIVRGSVAPVGEDRPPGVDVEAVAALIAAGAFHEA